MAELVELYAKGIKRKLENYWAAWLPGTHFEIGDVGTLNGYLFEKAATLDELKIKYYAETPDQPTSLDISSESGVSISFKAAGETNRAFEHIAAGEAGMKVDLASVGAFILQAPEVFECEVADRLNLQRQIVAAYSKGVWDKRWVVITRLVKATTATVIVSQSSNSSLEFSASANLASAYPALGKADAGLTMKHQSGSTIKVIGEKQLTPLFQLGCLKTGLFGGGGKVQTRSLRSKDPSVAELTPSHVAANKAAADSLVFDTVRDDEVIHE